MDIFSVSDISILAQFPVNIPTSGQATSVQLSLDAVIF
jgi:hypothetical protein